MTSPDWKIVSSDMYAAIWHPNPVVVVGVGADGYAWYPAPTDGVQSLGWVKKGTTVFQLLPDQIQTGVSYVLMADAGDGRYWQDPVYHPAVELTLCSGESETDPSTWTTLVETAVMLNSYGDTVTLSTPEYIGDEAEAGKCFGIKLTFSTTTNAPDYDLTWDNVRILHSAVATPTFTPDGGHFGNAQTVAINCATPGATIRYTTNGSDPTESNGTVISSGATVQVGSSMILKAKAWASGNLPSGIKSARYVVPVRRSIGKIILLNIHL